MTPGVRPRARRLRVPGIAIVPIPADVARRAAAKIKSAGNPFDRDRRRRVEEEIARHLRGLQRAIVDEGRVGRHRPRR